MAGEGTRLALVLVLTAATVHCQYRYPVWENTEIGAIVGDLRREDEFRNYRPSQLTLPLNSQHFELVGGIIKTIKELDRESFPGCIGAEKCWENMTCLVPVSGTKVSVKTISVEIVNVNDNSPTFTSATHELSLSEDIPVPYLLPIPTATDRDSPRYGISHYEHNGNPSRFKLVERDRSLYLNIIKELDAESVTAHYLRVTAYDGWTPRRSGSLSLTLRVLDSNDNRPRFESSSNNISLPEDTA